MELEIIMLSKISQTQKDKYCGVFPHMQNLDLKKKDMNIKEGYYGRTSRRWEGKKRG
jgi:hypothetical protein